MQLIPKIKQLSYLLPAILNKPTLYPKIVKGYFDTLVCKKNVMRYLELQVNVACNSKCIMCYASQMSRKNDKLLSLDEIKDIYKQLKPMGTIAGLITGGEPLLRKDLLSIFEILEARKNIFALVTNSISMTKEYVKELKKVGVAQFNLSLNSIDSKENDYQRGYEGHFDKVMQVTSWAQEAGLLVGYSVVVSHQNLSKIEKYVEFCEKKNVQFIPAWAVSLGRWTGHDEVRLSLKDWEYLHKLNNEHPCMRMDISTNYNCKTDCPGATEKLYITSYGEVSTCQLNPISFGSVRKESLKSIIARMRRVPSYSKIKPYCILSTDKEYISNYLEGIEDIDHTPVTLDEHPKLKGKII